MKIFVVSIGIMLVGLSAYVLGQSGPTHLKDITFSPDTRVVADDITYDQSTRTNYARGNVRIVSDSASISAEEADLHHLRDTRAVVDLAIDLRGNVRVSLHHRMPGGVVCERHNYL
jgi:lipopolysaccharide export system protein LptA